MTDPRALPRLRGVLWVCHGCEMIGNQQEAHGHQQAHGHDVEELDQATSDAIRDEWRAEQTRRAAGFLLAVTRRASV